MGVDEYDVRVVSSVVIAEFLSSSVCPCYYIMLYDGESGV